MAPRRFTRSGGAPPIPEEETMTEPKNPGFAHHPNEADEQRDEHVAALETELASVEQQGRKDRVKDVEAELARVRGAGQQKSTRLRGDA
jgi:hypothetical protein